METQQIQIQRPTSPEEIHCLIPGDIVEDTKGRLVLIADIFKVGRSETEYLYLIYRENESEVNEGYYPLCLTSVDSSGRLELGYYRSSSLSLRNDNLYWPMREVYEKIRKRLTTVGMI